jgi:lysylphosphatidylglycerol synthetase-like protein (DUF2156 family)
MQPGAQIAFTPPPPPRQRPTGITVLALLNFIGGGLAILLGIVFIAAGPIMAQIASGLPPIFSVLVGALGIGFLIAGLIGLVVGWGLWTGKGWAWWLTVILEALGLLSGLAGIARGDPTSLIGLLIAALILWYMFKPHVKDFFGVKVSFST